MTENKELPIAEKKQTGCGCGCIGSQQKDAKTVKPAAEEPRK